MSERVLSLEEIKQVELDILKYLHELCEKHQISIRKEIYERRKRLFFSNRRAFR